MDDNSIVELFWSRNEDAIKQTDLKYGKLCKNLSVNILNDESDAEECVNDSYLTLWNRIPDERPKYFCAFLCRIVKNLSLKKLEKITAAKRKPLCTVPLSELGDCVSGTDITESEYDASELAEKISQFLYRQDTLKRNIFVLRYWYCEPLKTIADRFGMKEHKVASVLFSMRQKLKKYLEKEGYLL